MINIEIFMAIIIVAILGTILIEKRITKIENWTMYRQLPYGHIKTGSKPLNFYRMDRYRKPYRYPVTFDQSYPTPHKSPFK